MLLQKFEPVWQHMINNLQEELFPRAPEHYIENLTPVFDRSCCTILAFHLKQADDLLKVHVLQSLTRPIYCVQIVDLNEPGAELGRARYYDGPEAVIQFANQPIAEKLGVILKTIDDNVRKFSGHQLIEPAALKQITLADLATQNKMFGKCTLYDCTFIDYLPVW